MTDAVCRWVRDRSLPEGRYLVPGCWGSVVGPRCTCKRPKEPARESSIERRLKNIEQRLAIICEALCPTPGGSDGR